ncbi:hypothetical protein PPTG_24565 [Phytophthora nicotianae INRA-310]|uniref:Uncharacterized protein n=1 Tax=Phytophthora nicotianae (strain INRA-310) TaxID=761204 RepID=W2PCV8_PHYN3|nr:hypothetical protein PPTG_24565 [Phytophthora nicotianae INRA-310]ETM98671.1 hypothetical protein PPTG_24565 [Phytophthora nicotianae INRA-310]
MPDRHGGTPARSSELLLTQPELLAGFGSRFGRPLLSTFNKQGIARFMYNGSIKVAAVNMENPTYVDVGEKSVGHSSRTLLKSNAPKQQSKVRTSANLGNDSRSQRVPLLHFTSHCAPRVVEQWLLRRHSTAS